MMVDWCLTGKRDTKKNNRITNTIGNDAIVTQIPIRQDVPEEEVGWDVVI